MSSVYAIVCSSSPDLYHTKLYASKELARKNLHKLASERRDKLGIHCFEENSDEFGYLLGWEERQIRFSIVELHVEE